MDIEGVYKREYGASGSDISGGVIQRPYLSGETLGEDYNTDFTIDKIDHMLDGDGQAFAVWNAISLAIQQAEWDMVPYSDSKQDREIATFLEEMLKPMWNTILSQVLNYLIYGFMLFEPLYKVVDGKIVWDRLAPRMPWTVDKWVPKNGCVGSVTQYAWDERNQMYNYFDIPGRKILRFTNRQNGSNFEGKSIMRGAYKHWDHKNLLYNILIIRHERYGVGLPVGTLPDNATDDQVAEYREILKAVRSNECGYIMLPRGVSIDDSIKILVPEGGEAGATGLIEGIEHHNIQIARSVLTQFINLGDTKTGARAVSEDMSSLFLMSLGSVVKYISGVISFGQPLENGGLRELVDMNWDNVNGYPVWKCEKIKKDDSSAILATIAQLVQAGALIHDESLEKHTRRLAGVPWEDVNVETLIKKEDQNSESGNESLGETSFEDLSPSVVKSSPQTRDRFPWEDKINFSSIEALLDNAANEFVAKWRKILKKQLDAMGEFFGSKLNASSALKVASAEMPFVDELAEGFLDILMDVYTNGKTSVKKELIAQADSSFEYPDDEEEEDDEDHIALLAMAAISAARSLSNEVKDSITDSILTGLAAGEVVRWDDVSMRAWSISDSTALSHSDIVNWAFGFGRENAAEYYYELIAEGHYSAVLDKDTCSNCRALDGLSTREANFTTPNPNCLGNIYSSNGNPCRCITVWTLVPGVSVSDLI